MKLVVGSRGNFNSTRAVIEGTQGEISEIYISVDNSRWGSGRSYVHEVDFQEIKRIAKFAQPFNIRLSLAFNTVCFGRAKLTRSFRADFTQMMNGCLESGFSHIILSDPMLMEIARDKCPSLGVIVSVFSEADSENKIRFFNDLGVCRIIVPHELNRNLKKLKRFAEISQCDLEVITNLGCVHYCARADGHSMFTGHYTGKIRERVFGDYYHVFCNSFKLNYPWTALSQDWIRPEDIYRYEEIGIKYFKIAGRATATTRIINTANAYLERSYHGNLFDLISSYYPFVEKMPHGKSPFYIENKKLDSIMEKLYNCGHNCENCSFCRTIYEKLNEGFKQNLSPVKGD